MRTSPDLSKQIRIPSPPTVCTLLNDAVNNPHTSTIAFAELISRDAALTARLLRLVNSSFYGFPSTIETPSQAVMVIGTAHLFDLAVTTSIARLFNDLPDDLVSLDAFWRHGVACGLAARVLAGYRHEPNVERFFVAGVLHDIGRLVIYQQAPGLARAALRRAGEQDAPLHRAERAVLGFDHAEVGAALLRAWALPESLAETVGCHHAPWVAQRYVLETAVVHVADVVAHAMLLGTSGERLVPALVPAAWDLIELPVDVLPDAVAAIERQFDDVSRAIVEESVA